MRKIYDKNEIATYIAQSKYQAVLDTLNVNFYLIKYKKGELLSSPFQKDFLFQIVEGGSVNIYFIREDGTRYSLSAGHTDLFLGDMEIFYPKNNNVYAEATENLTSLSFSIDKSREILLSNNTFLQLICSSLSTKIAAITTIDAAPASLAEKVLSFMKYKCDDGIMKGVEQTAFHLHCSTRQLQRILNQYESAGLISKIGKGTYRLNSSKKEEWGQK